MSTYFLKVEPSTGTCYELSKEPKEGFERKETNNPQGGITVSYRRYIKEGVFGRLTAMYERVNEWQGKKIRSLCVILKDGEDTYNVELPLVDQKAQIASFAESFIAYMPYLVIDQAYRLFPYAMESDKAGKDGALRKMYGVSMSIARLSDRAVDKENKVQKLTYAKWDKEKKEEIPGHIPLIEWEEGLDEGSVTPNKKKRTKYLYDTMKKYSVEYSATGGGVRTFNSKESAATTTAAPTQDEPKNNAMKNARSEFESAANPQPKEEPRVETFAAAAEDEDDDALPF